jgi:hypothetical protein
MKKSRKIREIHVWWGIILGSLLSLKFIPSFYHFLSLYYSFIVSFYLRDLKNIGVCELGEEGCICVKKK